MSAGHFGVIHDVADVPYITQYFVVRVLLLTKYEINITH